MEVQARSEATFQDLLESYISFARDNLNGTHYGEILQFFGGAKVTGGRPWSVKSDMVFNDLTSEEAQAQWAPWKTFFESRPDDFTIYSWEFSSEPFGQFWDPAYNGGTKKIPSKYAPNPRAYFWETNELEINALWFAYQSRWLTHEQVYADSKAGAK